MPCVTYKQVKEKEMNKKIVLVLQIDVPEDCSKGLLNSFEVWKKSVEGAYVARVKVDEVVVQED